MAFAPPPKPKGIHNANRLPNPTASGGASKENDDPYTYNKVPPSLGTAEKIEDEKVVFDATMEKWCQSTWELKGWQARRITVTREKVYFFKPGCEHIVDMIPLSEIDKFDQGVVRPSTVARGRSLLMRGKSILHLGSTSTMQATELQERLHRTALESINMKSEDAPSHQGQLKMTVNEPPSTENDETRTVSIVTHLDGVLGGRTYYLRASDEQEAQRFLGTTGLAHTKAMHHFTRDQCITRIQRRIERVYEHTYFQTFIAAMIMGNFFSSLIELQIRDPEWDHHKDRSDFLVVDTVFTLLFLAELLMNMACNWFWRFWKSAFNVFDFCIVFITTMSLLPFFDMKVISTLRLLRAFRVIRIFGRLQSARRIITAIGSSVEPVCNVLVVVSGIMAVFAMFGASAYPRSPHFQTFSTSCYTMFITLCLDGWNDLVETTEEHYPRGMPPPKLFFVLYIFIVVFILVPVFVAAILDGYRTAAYAQSEHNMQQKGREALQNEENVPCFSYDAILHGLLASASRDQLHERLKLTFQVLDVDDSGAVSFEETQLGFKKISGTATVQRLSLQEWEALTQGDKFVDNRGNMDCNNFTLAMEAQLRKYCMRKLSQYMLAIGGEEPGQEIIMFALKTLIEDNDSEGKAIDLRNQSDKLEVLESKVNQLSEKMDSLLHFFVPVQAGSTTASYGNTGGQHQRLAEIDSSQAKLHSVSALPPQNCAESKYLASSPAGNQVLENGGDIHAHEDVDGGTRVANKLLASGASNQQGNELPEANPCLRNTYLPQSQQLQLPRSKFDLKLSSPKLTPVAISDLVSENDENVSISGEGALEMSSKLCLQTLQDAREELLKQIQERQQLQETLNLTPRSEGSHFGTVSGPSIDSSHFARGVVRPIPGNQFPPYRTPTTTFSQRPA